MSVSLPKLTNQDPCSLCCTKPTVPNLIDGQLVPSKADRWIDLRNPATQELVGRVPQSTPEEVRGVDSVRTE